MNSISILNCVVMTEHILFFVSDGKAMYLHMANGAVISFGIKQAEVAAKKNIDAIKDFKDILDILRSDSADCYRLEDFDQRVLILLPGDMK